MRVTPTMAWRFCQKVGASPFDFYNWQAAYCGMHSGIPPCCVAYFLLVAMPLRDNITFVDDDRLDEMFDAENRPPKDPAEGAAFACEAIHANLFDFEVRMADGVGAGYRPCPRCALFQEFAPKLRRCRCGRNRKKLERLHDTECWKSQTRRSKENVAAAQ